MTRSKSPAAEVKAHFASFLREAERGGSVVITRHGRAVAELRPVRASEIAEPELPHQPAGWGKSSGGDHPPVAHRSARARREALLQFFENEVWSRLPEHELGRAPSKREREGILGYGDPGV